MIASSMANPADNSDINTTNVIYDTGTLDLELSNRLVLAARADERSVLMEQTAKVRDMTEGSIAKHLLAFSVPLLFGTIFQQIYNVVDTVVVGHYIGDNAIAAVGSTGAIYSLIINFAIGMNAGFAIVVTQAFGARDNAGLKQSIAGMTVLNAAVCLLLTAVSLLLLDPFMRLINVSDVIYSDARSYIAVILSAMAATTLYNMCSAILRSVGNSRAPLVFLLISSGLNVLLDVLFVAVFGLGVAGAAYATAASQAVSAIISCIYIVRNYSDILPRKADFRLKPKMVTELLGTGLAMALMYAVINIGGIIIQRAINSLGEVAVAAESAANKITDLMMAVFGALSTACSTLIGQNWGAKKKGRVKKCLRIAICMTTAWSVLCFALEALAGEQAIRLITGSSNEELISYALLNNQLQFTFFFVVGALIVMRTSLQAMGRKTAPLLSSITELTVTVVNAVFFVPRYGYAAQCIGKPTGWILMTMIIFAAYFAGRRRIYESI